MNRPHVDPRDSGGIAAVSVASLIWGSSFVLGKLTFEELAVGHSILYRFGIAALLYLPFLLRSPQRLQRRHLPLFALTGFLMVPITFYLQFGGLALTSATSTALMIGAGAPLLALAGALFEGERFGVRGWSAVAISTTGMAILAGAPGPGSDWRGNLMVLASMVVSTTWVMTTKRLIRHYPAWYATGWILVFGAAFDVPVALVFDGMPPVGLGVATWWAIAGLSVGCTVVAYVLWNWGVSRIGASPAGVYLNLEPASGAVAGIVLLGDAMGRGTIWGGALILAGAILVSTVRAAPASANRPTAAT